MRAGTRDSGLGTRESLLLSFVIPAKAGLRRQDAGANIRVANGPKGAQQELRVIHFVLRESTWIPGSASRTKLGKRPRNDVDFMQRREIPGPESRIPA